MQCGKGNWASGDGRRVGRRKRMGDGCLKMNFGRGVDAQRELRQVTEVDAVVTEGDSTRWWGRGGGDC